jgi:hypothetical protein
VAISAKLAAPSAGKRLLIQMMTAPEKMCKGLPEPVHHLLRLVALDTSDE